jgi:predicted transcriptional regulator
MYSALLSFSQLNSYLKYLEDRQLIIRINEDDAWMVTGAGREYLKQYKILANSLK